MQRRASARMRTEQELSRRFDDRAQLVPASAVLSAVSPDKPRSEASRHATPLHSLRRAGPRRTLCVRGEGLLADAADLRGVVLVELVRDLALRGDEVVVALDGAET